MAPNATVTGGGGFDGLGREWTYVDGKRVYEQLTIDGELVPYPTRPPRRLTERQRDLLRFMQFAGVIFTHEAYRHYADAGGALRRLEALGLVRRRGRGRWELDS